MGSQLGEGAGAALTEECIFCHQGHKSEEEEKLDTHDFPRSDDTLITNGRAFIKGDSVRSQFYPRDENGKFVSPLEDASWSKEAEKRFRTYRRGGRKIRRAEKYQSPPIEGYIAAPHHMIAICCMNGKQKLPSKPRVNPWAFEGGYDINNGGNCIFLPSSASQFFLAYYYSRVRGTGRPLQGHLGAHRKQYFRTVWDKLEMIAVLGRQAKRCDETSGANNKKELADWVKKRLERLELFLFGKLANRKPEEPYRLGAQSYIEIPEEEEDFRVPPGVEAMLQKPYETLPELDSQ